MFAPTRIEITNLGSIPHAVIEPDPNGITALDGPTGAGKSSALNALIWTCYGYVGGVDAFQRQNELRFDLCPDGEPVEAAVEFTWRGTHVRAVRRLRRNRAGKETAEAELWLDGERQLGMTPDRLTAKIEQITGMSGRAFVSTFFIPQMQLERIAMGTPAEVQALIEDRTGLTPLTTQIHAARHAALQAEAAADALPGSAEETDAAQKAVEAAQFNAIAAWDDWETADAAATAAKTTHTAARATLDTLLARQQATITAQRTISTLDGRIGTLAETAATLQAALAKVGPVPDRDTLAAEQRTIRDLVDAVRRAAADLRSATADLTDATRDHDLAEAAMVWHPADAATQAATAASRWETIEARRLALQATYRSVSADRKTLLDHAHDPTCPTCHQQMPDVSTLARLYDQQLAQIATEGRTLATEAADAATHRDQTAAAARQAAADQQTLDAARQRLAATQARHDTAHTHHDTALAALSTVTGEANLDTSERRLDDLANLLSACDQVRHLTRQLDTTNQALTVAARDLDTARAAATDAVTDTELATARETEWVTGQAAATAADTAHTAHLAAERTRAEVGVVEAARDAAVQRLADKVDALTTAETQRLAAATLAEQRKELLAQYTATISEAASRIMEQVGGGRHVGVRIDERFIPEVILADGRTRPVRACSGGEKMRAALCLCLGQVEQQSGGDTTGMLFADEIATGYDPDTTMAVMDMISSLGRPMVLIGHNEQVRQIAQRVYDVTNPDDTGTRVTLAGTTPAIPAIPAVPDVPAVPVMPAVPPLVVAPTGAGRAAPVKPFVSKRRRQPATEPTLI